MHLQQRHFTSAHTVRGSLPEEPEFVLYFKVTEYWSPNIDTIGRLKVFNPRQKMKQAMQVMEL